MRRSKAYRNIQLGIKNLLLHKLRSALTMLGVVFGVGSVIAMLSVGEGASRQAAEQIDKLGPRNIIINSRKSAEQEAMGNDRVRMSIYGLTYDDERRLKGTFEHVERVVPVKVFRKEARVRDRTLDTRLVGTTQDWFDLVRRQMLAGRPLSMRDVQDRASVVVLTEHGARRLLATEGTIGEVLRIGGHAYEVVGIVKSAEPGASTIQLPDQEIDAYIPISTSIERYGDINVRRTSGSRIRERVELHQVIVEVNDMENVEDTAAGIEAMLARFHPMKDYRMSVPLALLRQAEATARTFNIVLGSIAGISLLVGGIGIMNIMMASVTERTREIGIRRAIGAKRGQIIVQFLIETIVLSTAGGLIGIMLGVGLPWVITLLADMPTVVSAWSLMLSLGISMGVGIVFGIYPAIRAANLDPIEALRYE